MSQADYEKQQKLLRARRTGELGRDLVETSLIRLIEEGRNWSALQKINKDTLMSLEEVCWRYNPRAWWLLYKRFPRSMLKGRLKNVKSNRPLLRTMDGAVDLWRRKFPEATMPTIFD